MEEESACISGKRRLGLNQDHSKMCKFNSSDDQDYINVANVLRNWVRNLDALQGRAADNLVYPIASIASS